MPELPSVHTSAATSIMRCITSTVGALDTGITTTTLICIILVMPSSPLELLMEAINIMVEAGLSCLAQPQW